MPPSSRDLASRLDVASQKAADSRREAPDRPAPASPTEPLGAPGGHPTPTPALADLLPSSMVARLVDEPARFVRKGFARVAEFLPTRLNLSWITDDLAVGGAFGMRHIPRLRRIGIDAVIDCREEDSDDEAALGRHGIAFLRLPTPDAHQMRQADLEVGVAWALARFALGDRLYVHCLHGVGRAPLLGSCILVATGYAAAEAVRLVKTRRWQASPNEEQLEAFLEFVRRRNDARTDSSLG